MRARRRIALLALLAALSPAVVLLSVPAAGLLALPSVAGAQTPTSPFSPGLPAQSTTAPTTTTPTVQTVTSSSSSSSGGGLSGSGAIAIAAGAVIVLGGISLFIWRDARRRAPLRVHDAGFGAGTRSGSKAPAKPRKLSPAERRRRKRGRAR